MRITLTVLWMFTNAAAAADFSFRPLPGALQATFEGRDASPAHELFEIVARARGLDVAAPAPGRSVSLPDLFVRVLEGVWPPTYRAVFTLDKRRCDWLLTSARPTAADDAYVTQLFLKDAPAGSLYNALRAAGEGAREVITTPSLEALHARGVYTAEVRSHARGQGAPVDPVARVTMVLEPDPEKIFVVLSGPEHGVTHDLHRAAGRPKDLPLAFEPAPGVELSTRDVDGGVEYVARLNFPITELGWEWVSHTAFTDPLTQITLPVALSQALFELLSRSALPTHITTGKVTYATPNFTVEYCVDADQPTYRATLFSRPGP